MIRFYGFGYREVLELPLRTFWCLNDQIDRLQCDEHLALMPALGAVMGGDGVKKVVEDMKRRVGNPAVVEQTQMSMEDKDKAKRFFGKNKEVK